MASVLVTRPAHVAAETVARLAALGHEALIAPLLRIEPLAPGFPPSGDIDAVVVASRHAVDGVPDEFARRPVFAVGDATAAHARARFATVLSAEGDARALARLVARHRGGLAGTTLLLAAARGEGGTLAGLLRAEAFSVHRRSVYAQRTERRLPAAVRSALEAGTLTHALFFSANTAGRFAQLVAARAVRSETLRRVVAVTIGPAAAVALEALPWRDLRVAARPTQEEMLALLS